MNRFLFTRSEIRGIAFLVGSILLLRMAIVLLPAAQQIHPLLTSDSLPNKRMAQVVAEGLRIDINRSDSLEFEKLKGIGPVFGSRIVRYRQLLGGFVSVWQLAEVYGIDSSWVEAHIDELILDTSMIVKLDLNDCAFRDLLRHPYLSYENVKAICRYRDTQGPIRTPVELLKEMVLPDSVWIKVNRYFYVDSESSILHQ